MRFFRRLILSAILTVLPSMGAMSDDFFPTFPAKLEEVRSVLRDYLHLRRGNEVKRALIDLRLQGDQALLAVLEEILSATAKATAESLDRIEWALELATRIVLRTSVPDATGAEPPIMPEMTRVLVMEKMQKLLRYHSNPSLRQKKIVFIYDLLRLWSRADLWFIAPRVASPEGLQKYHSILLAILPELNHNEAVYLESFIRRVRPSNLLQYTTLYQMDRAEPRDFVNMFRLYSRLYAEAFHSFTVPNGAATIEWGEIWTRDFENSKVMLFLDEILDHLRYSLRNGDPVITEALKVAEHQTRESRSKDGLNRFRLFFFDQVSMDMDGIFRLDTIRQYAEGALQNGEYVLPVLQPPVRQEKPERPNYKAAGNILYVDFTRGTSCSLVHKP